jgi:hypothetical protein
MKLEYRYYVAKRTEDGLLKIAHEEVGPYYNTTVLVSRNGYETRVQATEAVARYIQEYRTRYGYGTTYTYMIMEEMTMSEEDKNE